MYDDVRYKHLEGERRVDTAFVYGLSYCDHCRSAIEFLETEGIGLKYVYLDRIRGEIRKRVTKDLEDRRGEKLVYPILEVNGRHYFGFDPNVWRDTLLPEASPAGTGRDGI